MRGEMGHPLEIFRYCPVCGSEHFLVNNFKSKKCQDCGFTYYANPCSATAAFIVNCLKRETDKEKIVEAMAAEYDAPREVIAADVEKVLDKLRSIGALEE